MKTLVMLLLFVATARAQTSAGIDATWDYLDSLCRAHPGLHLNMRTFKFYYDRPTPKRQSTQWLMREARINVLLALYSRYEKECWNDSTQALEIIPWHGGLQWDTIYVDGKAYARGTWLENDLVYRPARYCAPWTHRVPTFSSFIGWLRTQERAK